MIIYLMLTGDRGIAQLVEQWSPKPRAEGSIPSAPAKCKKAHAYAWVFFYNLKHRISY